MKKLFLTIILILVTRSVFADFSDKLQAKYPQTKGARIAKAFGNFYSVIVDDNVIYFNEDLSILINGDVVDLNTNRSLTATLRESIRPKFNIADLNVKDAIKFGSGGDILYVFSDPDCPYCRQLEREFDKLSGVTIYIFPFPLSELHPNAMAIAEDIWCSKDKATAWHSYVAFSIKPTDGHCDTPIERNIVLAKNYKIMGTPAIVFSDGTIALGAIPASAIQAQIVKSKIK